jgi:hypothetical protein
VNVVYAIETGSLVSPDGGSVLIRKGTHWDSRDAIVRAYPQWFSADPRYGLSWTGDPPTEMAEPPIEQVTAGPGERRNVRRTGGNNG